MLLVVPEMLADFLYRLIQGEDKKFDLFEIFITVFFCTLCIIYIYSIIRDSKGRLITVFESLLTETR